MANQKEIRDDMIVAPGQNASIELSFQAFATRGLPFVLNLSAARLDKSLIQLCAPAIQPGVMRHPWLIRLAFNNKLSGCEPNSSFHCSRLQ